MMSAEAIESSPPPKRCQCSDGLGFVNKKDKHFLKFNDLSPKSSQRKQQNLQAN
jgi:hypothetical protein